MALFALGPPAADAGGRIGMEVLSSNPDRVTGGDALIAVSIPAGIKPAKVGIRLNGRRVEGSFSPTPGDARRLTGVVTGMKVGANDLSAWGPGARNRSSLRVFNSPATGPVFSGPHQMPYFCRTVQNGLGEATDSNCSAPLRTEFFYKSTDGDIKPLAVPDIRPPDLAQTTLNDGRTVDYLIRMESGTINRAVYRWAMLVPGGDPYAGWNERLIYRHGGGCSAGFQQGRAGTDLVLDDLYLKRGFAVVTSSLNVFQTACNDVLSAETASMVKEHVTEELERPPHWTIGVGGSGGSIQIQMSSQNYPGLFDGIIPTASFPDNALVPQPDCRLLYRYFDSPGAADLTPAQRIAVTGIKVEDSCRALGTNTANVIDASEGCEGAVPSDLIFDPVTNPDGIRCTIFESMVNVYGRNPATGYARRPLDNVGREYGLLALQEGSIDLDEFLDLNEKVGGFDTNGDFSPERSVGDPEALETMYRTGRINQGAGGVPGVPIIDARAYADDAANVHVYVPTYQFRARIRAANGTAANHVMYRARGSSNVRPMNEEALDTMSDWLDRIKADRSKASLPSKVIRNRPAKAVDACWANGGERIDDPAEIDSTGPCTTLYPPNSLPDLRAGKPLGSIAAKCRLRPINAADYGNPAPSQLNRLRAIFPDGVCDYSKPGVGQQPLAGTDISYGPDQTAVDTKRRLRVGLGRRKARSARVAASLAPCPEVTWQRVVFERKTRRAKRWRPAGAKLVRGAECRATIRIRAARRPIRVRVAATATPGFSAATATTTIR